MSMTDVGETSVQYVALENGAGAEDAQVCTASNGSVTYAHDPEWSHGPNTPVVYASPIASPLVTVVYDGKEWDEVRDSMLHAMNNTRYLTTGIRTRALLCYYYSLSRGVGGEVGCKSRRSQEFNTRQTNTKPPHRRCAVQCRLTYLLHHPPTSMLVVTVWATTESRSEGEGARGGDEGEGAKEGNRTTRGA